MATEAYCPTCKKDTGLVDLNRESEIPQNVFPQMCSVCGREFTIDGYTTILLPEEGKRL